MARRVAVAGGPPAPEPPAAEEVLVCRDCRTPSPADVRGLRAFRVIIRGSRGIALCAPCADAERGTA